MNHLRSDVIPYLWPLQYHCSNYCVTDTTVS